MRALSVKYGIDRVVGIFATVFLSPLFLFIALLITLEALIVGEPPMVFFIEKRLSARRKFSMLKFRIIRVSMLRQYMAEHPLDSVRLLERKAENLTRVGKILRRIHADQLPQVVNLLKGEISLVGPRPYSEHEWELRPSVRIMAREKLKGGLIGPYQAVNDAAVGGSAANEADTEYFDFAIRASPAGLLARDIRIIVQGLKTLLFRILKIGQV